MRPCAHDRRRHRRRAFLPGRSARDGQPQGFAHEPVRPCRQRRAGRSASCCRWRCRKASARHGSALLRPGLPTMRAHYGCPLYGGDTDHTPGPISVSIFAFGAVPQGKMVHRSTARPGDCIVSSPARSATRRSGCSFGASDAWRGAGGCPMPLPTQSRRALSPAAAAQRARRRRLAIRVGGDRRFRRACRRSRQALPCLRRSPPTSMSMPCRSRTPRSAAIAAEPALWRPRSPAATTMRSCLTLAPERLAGLSHAAAAGRRCRDGDRRVCGRRGHALLHARQAARL